MAIYSLFLACLLHLGTTTVSASSSSIVVPPSVTGYMALMGERRAQRKFLSMLLNEKPIDKERIKKIIKLDIEHTYLLEDKNAGWQDQLRRIESEPEYIPQAANKLNKLVEKVPVSRGKVSPPLWLATSEDGHKLYLVGTNHSLRIRHLSPSAIARLGEIWDKADAILWEGDWAGSVYKVLREHSYHDALRQFKQLDYQILVFGINRGDKEIDSLGGSAGTDKRKQLEREIEERLDREGHNKFIDPRSNKENSALTEGEKEQYLEENVGNHELTFLQMTSYVNYDVAGLAELNKRKREHYRTHLGIRDALWEEYLLDGRNQIFLQSIKNNFKHGKTLMIISGNAHMIVGNENISSIITLLRKDGFQVELLPP